MIENEQAFYDIYSFFFDLPFDIKRKGDMFEGVIRGEPWIWQVIGITEKALNKLAENNFKNDKLICRAHFVDRKETSKKIFTKKFPREELFEYFFKMDSTVIALKDENKSNSPPPSQFIPIDPELKLFTSAWSGFNYRLKERQHLKKLYADYEAGKVHIEKLNLNIQVDAINNPILETVDKNKKQNNPAYNSEENHPQLKFWIEFDKFLHNKEPTLKRTAIPRRGQYYYNIVSLCSSYYIALTIHLKENKLGCQVYIPNSKKIFDVFYSKRHQIETQIKKNNGDVLEWQRLNEKKASRIILFHTFNFEKQSKIDAFEWLLQMTKEFKNIFKPNGV